MLQAEAMSISSLCLDPKSPLGSKHKDEIDIAREQIPDRNQVPRDVGMYMN